MPIHVESDFCDRSGVEYFLAKKRLENFRVVVFRSEGKILLTLFGDHIFHLVTENKFQSRDGAGLKKVNFGPSVYSPKGGRGERHSGTTAISHLLIIAFQRGSRHGLTIFGDMIYSDNI